ncbi:hypothetical protein B484DRAFT_473198, partial [Ochromonadaceae sp. CCMP2298]
LYGKVFNTVKSITERSVQHTGYYFDGLLPNAYGQATNALQYAHHHCQVFCAKTGPSAELLRELEVSNLVHEQQTCPTVMRIVTKLELPNDRLTLICPYYPATVAILPPNECSLAMLNNVALCTLASIAAFRNVSKSHNDIKPTNLMLTSTSQLIMLIDFGSAVDFGAGVTSRGTSVFWGRGCPAGTLKYDMACLASVQYSLHHGDSQDALDLPQLSEHVQALPRRSIIGDMILQCIHRAGEDIGVIFTEWVDKVASVNDQLEAGTVVDCLSIFPAPN